MKSLDIRYCFTLPDRSREVFDLRLDPESLELLNELPETLPPWTLLDFCQCPHCPLTPKTHSHCPLAAHLVNIVERFESIVSHEKIDVDVITKERVIRQETAAQRGISSLMGLVMATSGCPHVAYFRPMARFHLPFSVEGETIFRAVSMYLLAQYFLKQEGQDPDFDLEGLTHIYENMRVLNVSVADRLRAASDSDSTLNAVIVLDANAHAVPMVIEESLRELRYLFAQFFAGLETFKS